MIADVVPVDFFVNMSQTTCADMNDEIRLDQGHSLKNRMKRIAPRKGRGYLRKLPRIARARRPPPASTTTMAYAEAEREARACGVDAGGGAGGGGEAAGERAGAAGASRIRRRCEL
jgi:hypothetical protein